MKLSTKKTFPVMYLYAESNRVAFCQNNYIFTTVAEYSTEELTLAIVRISSISQIVGGTISTSLYGRTVTREIIRRAIAGI